MSSKRPSLIRLARRFPGAHARCYAWCKLVSDPLYPAVWAALEGREAPLLDVGCGMGLCALYLRACGWRATIHGLDFDATKIVAAKQAAASHAPDLVFETADARSGLPAHLGHVTILDILQYFDPAEQATLLMRAAERVAPRGRLIIRTGLRAPGWRFALTERMDRFAKKVAWMKAAPIHYPTPDSLREPLQAAGMEGTIRPLWGWTPFNNWLAVFERPTG